MVPDIVDTTVLSSVDTEFMGKVSSFDCDSRMISESITFKIVSLFFLVVVVVRSNYINLLSKSS